MRIGIVLGGYPVPSETFIVSFLSHLSNKDIYLYTKVLDAKRVPHGFKVFPYLNHIPPFKFMREWLFTWLRIVYYWNRAIGLRKKGVPLKQLIADAGIWTTKELDYLHFPFANLAFGREHYAELLGAKMTLSFRGSDINVFPIFHNKSYESLLKRSYRVHCNSKELAALLVNHNAPTDLPIRIIQPALRADLAESTFVKEQKRLGNEPLRVLTIGRLHWIKDYPLAFQALANLKLMGQDFEYLIIGDGPEKEHLLFLANLLDIRDNIQFLGKQTGDNVIKHLKKSDIYLQTSLAEGFSNACLEAQAFGLPCVVPNISGMQDCIEEGKTGRIINNRNPMDFAQAIKDIANHTEAFNSEYIAKRVRTQFTLEKQSKEWLAFFEE